MTDWQDISTAPKMEAVLVFHPYYSAGQVRHAFRNREGYWCLASDDGYPSLYFQPTHWMPLPLPPAPRAVLESE